MWQIERHIDIRSPTTTHTLTIIRDRLGLIERRAQELHEVKQAQRHHIRAPPQQPQRVAPREEEKRPAKHRQMHAPEPTQHKTRQANAAQTLVGMEGGVASSGQDVEIQASLQLLDLPHGLAGSLPGTCACVCVK